MRRCFRYISFTLSFMFFANGLILKSYNTILVGILFMLLNNIIYSLEKYKDRILFLFFNIVMFIFLIARPTISFFSGNKWYSGFSKPDIMFALYALFISLLCLYIGALIANHKRHGSKKLDISFNKESRFNISLRNTSLIIFYLSMIAVFIMEAEKLMFMRGRAYEDYYILFKSNLPGIIYYISIFSKYALCIFLATMPKKRQAFIPFVIYILAAFPDLIIGQRNPIVLNTLFAVSYYIIRDSLGDSEKWIDSLEKSIIIIGTPFVLLALGAYNYIRADQTVSIGVFGLLLDFFYKQGVSFEVLMIGHNTIPKLPVRPIRNYTFGAFIDYMLYGSIGQLLFGTTALPQGNNIKMATLSNSFAHNMSYIARGNDYLNGMGWGSSFLLETYTDYKYFGIIIFSILLGLVLIKAIPLVKKNTFVGTIILLCLTQIFFLPRDAATAFISFVIQYQFWFCIIIIYVIASVFTKSYSYKKDFIRRNNYV